MEQREPIFCAVIQIDFAEGFIRAAKKGFTDDHCFQLSHISCHLEKLSNRNLRAAFETWGSIYTLCALSKSETLDGHQARVQIYCFLDNPAIQSQQSLNSAPLEK